VTREQVIGFQLESLPALSSLLAPPGYNRDPRATIVGGPSGSFSVQVSPLPWEVPNMPGYGDRRFGERDA